MIMQKLRWEPWNWRWLPVWAMRLLNSYYEWKLYSTLREIERLDACWSASSQTLNRAIRKNSVKILGQGDPPVLL